MVLRNSESLEVVPPEAQRGVLYLGHIPFGFYEDALEAFFTQFGLVTRLRLSRNSKVCFYVVINISFAIRLSINTQSGFYSCTIQTSKAKHYAFIEMAHAEVATIAAAAMNGYMMFGRTLTCHVVPSEKVRDFN